MFGPQARLAIVANRDPPEVENELELMAALRSKLGPHASEERLLYHLRSARGKIHWAVNSYFREVLGAQSASTTKLDFEPKPAGSTAADPGSSTVRASHTPQSCTTEDATINAACTVEPVLTEGPMSSPSRRVTADTELAGAQQLPGSLVEEVMKHLDLQSLCSAAMVSKTFRMAALSNEIWRCLFQQRWGAYIFPLQPTSIVRQFSATPSTGTEPIMPPQTTPGTHAGGAHSSAEGALLANHAHRDPGSSCSSLPSSSSSGPRASSTVQEKLREQEGKSHKNHDGGSDAEAGVVPRAARGLVSVPSNTSLESVATAALVSTHRSDESALASCSSLSAADTTAHFMAQASNIPLRCQSSTQTCGDAKADTAQEVSSPGCSDWGPPPAADTHSAVMRPADMSRALSGRNPPPPRFHVASHFPSSSSHPTTNGAGINTLAASLNADQVQSSLSHLIPALVLPPSPAPDSCATPTSSCTSTQLIHSPLPASVSEPSKAVQVPSAQHVHLHHVHSSLVPSTAPPSHLPSVEHNHHSPTSLPAMPPTTLYSHNSTAQHTTPYGPSVTLRPPQEPVSRDWKDTYRTQHLFTRHMQCPQCGNHRIVPIIYGFPSPALLLGRQHKRLILGGDHLIDRCHVWACTGCNAGFRYFPFEDVSLWVEDNAQDAKAAAASNSNEQHTPYTYEL